MDVIPRQVLVVANRTAATPLLLDLVKERAQAAPHRFTLLVPDAGDAAADWTIESALPLLTRAAGAPVEGISGGPDAYEAIHEAVLRGTYDEIVISTLPHRTSHWLRRDLPDRVRRLVGVPVTVITPED